MTPLEIHNRELLKENKQLKEDFEYWKKRIRKECNLVEGQEFSRLMGIHDESQLWLKHKDEWRDNKEKLKHYTEPFEMRPTYQVLEQKLDKIRELLNKSYLYSNTSIFESNLKEILGKK